MKLMTNHGSATSREETPHDTETTNTPAADDRSTVEKVEALTEIICRAGDDTAAALFVLMGTLQSSAEPEVLAHAAKHYAFTRCGELNVFGMVDAQIAVIGGELLKSSSLIS
jgi:hypothetical protein